MTPRRGVNPIAGLVLVAPFDLAVPADGFGPLFVRPLMIVTVLLAALALVRSQRRPAGSVALSAGVLVGAIWLSTMLADDRTASAAAALRLSIVVLVLVAASTAVRTPDDVRVFTGAVAAATIVASVVGLATHFAGQELLGTEHLLGSISESNGVRRLTRPFSQTNVAAMFLGPATAISAVQASRTDDDVLRRLSGTAAVLGTLAMAFTLSNGGVLALTVALLIGAVLLVRTPGASPAFAIGLGAALVLTRVTNPDWDRRSTFVRGTNGDARPRPLGRRDMWEQAVDALLDRPVTGLGPGRFGAWSVSVTPERFVPAPHAHSVPFELLATTGAVGLLALAAVLVVSALRVIGGGAHIALLIGVVAILVHGVVDYGLIFASSGVFIAAVIGATVGSTSTGETG